MINKILNSLSSTTDSGIMRCIPVKAKGRLYVSPMPFGAYDKRNRLLSLYRQNRIKHVFILVQDSEIKAKAKKDIKHEYEKIGAAFTQYAFKDMHAPDLDAMVELVKCAVAALKSGNIAIHCHAGVGRTSVGACCVVQAVERMAPLESIAYVKKHMKVDMTSEQQSAVMKFEAKFRECL